jgi:phage-related protein
MPLPRRLTYRFRTKRKPDLTVTQILGWCDAFHDHMKRWPNRRDAPFCLPDTTWPAIDGNLQKGTRGLPGGSSLAKLLLAHRGVRHHLYLPPLTVPQILAWADEHHKRTGGWPLDVSGRIPEARGETWRAVEKALRKGRRGLPGGETLARFLERHRGARNHLHLPPLTIELILKWADDHHRRTGRWPVQAGGPVHGVPEQTWNAVDTALAVGVRGLPGESSLACLLEEHRGVRNHMRLPDYTPEQILAWADAYKARTGKWPTGRSGPIPDAPGETWLAVASALVDGKRGLPGGDSISRLLVRHRGWRNKQAAPRLTVKQIRAWAIAHLRQTGVWPTRESGPIHTAPGETWCAADLGLKRGQRGLPGGSSLSRVVRRCRDRMPATQRV